MVKNRAVETITKKTCLYYYSYKNSLIIGTFPFTVLFILEFYRGSITLFRNGLPW